MLTGAQQETFGRHPMGGQKEGHTGSSHGKGPESGSSIQGGQEGIQARDTRRADERSETVSWHWGQGGEYLEER